MHADHRLKTPSEFLIYDADIHSFYLTLQGVNKKPIIITCLFKDKLFAQYRVLLLGKNVYLG